MSWSWWKHIQIKNVSLCMMLTIMLSACGQTDHYAPVALLKEVDRYMAPEFVKGVWRYRGARAIDEGVAVYIQIPDRLDISEDLHKTYLIETICPKADAIEFWRKLIRYDFYLRTYNYVERNYIQAKCPKPFNL